ncbi:MAG: nucleotidyltransferase family protein [Oscillospiraceae bacterium]|nr:nucleotidyltransferase family protein [Oscillospiraceae bacterium]
MAYRFGCVVMAAGRSERFGENKLLRELDGKPLALRTLEAIPRDAFAKIITVTRFAEIRQFSETLGFAVVENDAPEEGLSRTIWLGLAETADCDAVLFTVADQPMLSRETFLRLLAAWKPGRICAAAEGGRRGNPCLFCRSFFPELNALSGDHGGASVIRRHEDALTLVEATPAELWDCDTPKALEDLKEELRLG